MKGMKKVMIVSAVMSAMMLSGHSRAATGEELKIGTVSFQQALNDVEQGKKAKAALKAEFDAKQKKLSGQQDELKKMQEEAQKQGSVLSQDAMAQKQKVFQEKFMDLQKSMASYRDELMSKEAKSTGLILQNLKQIVSEIGQKDGYTLIVETSQDAVPYAKSKDDLTARVVTIYNQRFTSPLKME